MAVSLMFSWSVMPDFHVPDWRALKPVGNLPPDGRDSEPGARHNVRDRAHAPLHRQLDLFIRTTGSIFRGISKMAENTPAGPVETGAELDFDEHERTYHLFLNLAKYGTLFCAALLISMSFGFFTPAGFISSLLLFIIIIAIGAFLL
jgi:hypothetical protein